MIWKRSHFVLIISQTDKKMNKTVLITGASSGFGLAVANTLKNNGYNVIGTSRNPEKYQNKVSFKLIQLDLDNEQSIQSFSQLLLKETQTVDVLINNAGYMLKGLAEETPIEIGKKQFETNFWGTVELTNQILPIFRKQKSGKIITVSSFVGLIGHPNISFYSASKHALEGYFKSLRFELSQFNVKVAMVEPQYFKTNLGPNSIQSSTGIADYDDFRKKVIIYTDKSIADAPQPDAVLDKIVKLVEDKEPKFSNPIGKGTSIILTLQRLAYTTFEKSVLGMIAKSK